MSEFDFTKPQHQSKVGILLIFGTTVYQLARSLWVLGVSLFIADISNKTLLLVGVGIVLSLLLAFVFSVLSYRRFRFYVNKEKGEFILEKGVFSSEVISIPFHKIQQVNFKRNLLQRLIGVYSVVLDTAGSKDKEVEIKALSRERADALGEVLMKLATEEKASEEAALEIEAPQEAVVGPEVLWEYKLPFLSLLKLGLTSNYFRGLAILLAFYFSLQEQFQFSEELLEVPNPLLMELASQIIFIGFLVLVGMLLTLGETFVKYWNLEVRRTQKSLQVEMGLKENTKVNLKPQRVQLLQVLTNPLQQRLNLYQVKISLASSQGENEKDKIKIPGLPAKVVADIKDYFYSVEKSEERQMFPDKIILFRRISRGVLVLIIALFAVFISSLSPYFHWALCAGAGYLILMLWFQVLFFRSLRLSVSEEFLTRHSGVWVRKKQLIEMYKLQAVSLSQPLWYKRRGIANLTFHTAGGDVRFNFVHKEEAEALRDYLLYKIETAQKPWM